MCLIIFSPDFQKSRIDPEDLQRAFKVNDDGAGMAYIKNGNLITDKPYFKWKHFKKAYDRATENLKGPLLVHFRLSTSGVLNRENAHPFTIQRNKLVMAHNGIFSELSYDKSKISDTVRFVNIIKKLDWKYPYNADQQKLLEIACGGYNKLVFLDNNSDYVIINEDAGVWKGNCWYSNTHSFKPKQVRFRKQRYDLDENSENNTKYNKDAFEMYRQIQALARGDGYNDFAGEDNDFNAARYERSLPWGQNKRLKILNSKNVMIGSRISDPDYHYSGYGLSD